MATATPRDPRSSESPHDLDDATGSKDRQRRHDKQKMPCTIVIICVCNRSVGYRKERGYQQERVFHPVGVAGQAPPSKR